MFTRILRSPDAVDGSDTGKVAGATATDAATELPPRGADGKTADLRARQRTWIGVGQLSDESVRHMMGDVCHFLRQIVAITSQVVESIGIGQVRKIVGPELAIPRGIIREDGKISDKPTPAEPELDRDHRKGPRGGKHPLTVLIQIALQAAKLLEKIAAGTNPVALDREPLAERQQRAADREQRLAESHEPYMDFGR